MPKKLFAIVGYTNHGKSHTLYELFERRQFFPLKSPIITDRFGPSKFTVINASNEDRLTKDYLDRLKEVLEQHQESNTIFVITISLIFHNVNHDAKVVFEFLNTLPGFEVNYIVLDHGWYARKSLATADIDAMKQCVDHNTIHHFDQVINESRTAFSERTDRIGDRIRELIHA